MRTLTFLTVITLAGCGANPANEAWRNGQDAKTTQAIAECDAALAGHPAYMASTPPKAASGQVAEAWNVQQEAKIQGMLQRCKPAMRQGVNAHWFVAETRQGEAYEKLMVELGVYYDAVPAHEKAPVLRRLIDAAKLARDHYGFAVETAEANPKVGAQNAGMLATARAKVPELNARYTALKAVQAKQHE